MGSSASISDLYNDADGWFRAYIDEDSCTQDFFAIDVDHNGEISLDELVAYGCRQGPTLSSGWGLFLDNPQILDMAYQAACCSDLCDLKLQSSKTVRLVQFRPLLMHIYVISLLWAHFRNANKWGRSREDHVNGVLNCEEFKVACATISACHGIPLQTEDKLEADFRLIDFDNSNSASFAEVCNYCHRFVDQDFQAKSAIEAEMALQPHSARRLMSLVEKKLTSSKHHSLFSKVSKLLCSPICGPHHKIAAPDVHVKQEFQNAFALLHEEYNADTKKSKSLVTALKTPDNDIHKPETLVLSSESNEIDM